MKEDWNSIEQFARSLLQEAAENIKSSLYDSITINTKSNENDLVTNKDEEIEKFFYEKIKKKFPNHYLLGEEGKGDELNQVNGIVWILDPIDGTMNFVHQKRNFAISLGIYENGIGKMGFILDVIHNELYFAKKGEGAYLNDQEISPLKNIVLEEAIVAVNAIWLTKNRYLNHEKLGKLIKKVRGSRSYGSAAIEMVYVAMGRIDAYITPRLSPWDFAAGKIIVEELGGICTTLKNEELSILKKSSVLVSNSSIQKDLITDYIEFFQ
ncbi:inositol monophosphatase family protein [Gottfriedia luciferensis]|uniref:inositol monophosphatase family protein n=1 Tax=Gottfriedia luciferensis TaxID=178774 RepID=UPI000B4401CD|nr:inositol monophosphatase family protein [Gottfriedia luciferensis]